MPASTAIAPTYRRLRRRNATVRVLRILLPLTGAAVLFALMVQIVLSSLGARFSVGSISVSPEAVTVEAPDYFGTMQDGSSYRVSAASARAAVSQPDLIALERGKLVYDRIDRVQFTVDTSEAQLDTSGQRVLVPGVADISSSEGTVGEMNAVVFDFRSQILTADGAVRIDYADDTSVRAEGLVHDAASNVWTFTRSVVTLPSTPGEDLSPQPDGDMSP